MSALCDPGNKQSPAVAFTATGVHPCMALGMMWTASSKRMSRLCTAPSGLPANEDRPGCVILNTLYSYLGEGPQLLNLYTWILEPVEPASIISAYCMSMLDEEWGWVQCVIVEGSRSVSYESGWVVVVGFGAGTGGLCCCWVCWCCVLEGEGAVSVLYPFSIVFSSFSRGKGNETYLPPLT